MHQLQFKSIDLYLYLNIYVLLLLLYSVCKAPWEATLRIYFISIFYYMKIIIIITTIISIAVS